MFLNLILPMRGMDVSEAQLKLTKATLKKSLKVPPARVGGWVTLADMTVRSCVPVRQTIEGWLGATGWVGGTAKPSVADLTMACEITQLVLVDYSVDDLSNIVAWLDRLRRIPAFAKVCPANCRLSSPLVRACN